ncbi:glutathione S-transferase family protein [Kordiimonas sp. SCSIO 12610]|uniref:glutathione S-transferase family protein n=1 Tax=Kordiimonas sp. SCSIO 12610 TaxID=2829597 RepID=UPI00210E5014|nr:glutathione S-transferase family protein [Kordiimonas sp. SCSIO 12610]UTW55271.1 glutathione S-transferase family protein [Kordiimonas sp. SCSIO 12610]
MSDNTETGCQDRIKLYGYATSPFVMKVSAYLKYKGLPYTYVHVRPRTNEAIKFTGQTQVPVLEINDEWRKNSSDLGAWLDERYPEKPLLGNSEAEKQTIWTIDRWISDVMIPARFREAVDWTNSFNSILNGWRLAKIVNFGTAIPLQWRLMWPVGVKRAPFIVDMVNTLDRSEPMEIMRSRILDELEAHIEDGPFLGGLKLPSLADFSAYPIIISPWLIGMRGDFSWKSRPVILNWMKAVQSHLPDNPLPVDERFLVREMPF